jgi:hypothetical protein
MPAKNLSRIDQEGLYFHIYNRGIEKKVIFSDKADYDIFLSYIKDYLSPAKDPASIKQSFQVNGKTFQGIPHQPKNYFNHVQLLGYSLMPGHFHLIVYQTTKGSVEKFMRSLCTRYSMYFNKKYQHTGSLFEGPYKSVPIEQSKLPYLTLYIHQNSSNSSNHEYLNLRNTDWVKTETVLTQLKDNYKNFVEHTPVDIRVLEGLTIENQIHDLERSAPKYKVDPLESNNPTSKHQILSNPDSGSRPNMPTFLFFSVLPFIFLVSIGLVRIKLIEAKNSQIASEQTVLSAASQAKPETAPEASFSALPETISETVTVTILDGSDNVNIREQPSLNSPKIGQAKNGDIFEFISLDSGWYEVKFASSSAFISSKYLKEGKN